MIGHLSKKIIIIYKKINKQSRLFLYIKLNVTLNNFLYDCQLKYFICLDQKLIKNHHLLSIYNKITKILLFSDNHRLNQLSAIE